MGRDAAGDGSTIGAGKSRHLAMALPYIAILIGLHAARSAWLAILLYHAGMMILLVRTRPRDWWREFRLGWHPGLGVPLALMGLGAGPLVVLLWPIPAAEGRDLAATLAALGLHGVAWWLFVVYYITVHPLLEEAFWRGCRFSRSGHPALVDAAFAGYHALVLPYFLSPLWTAAAVGMLFAVAWLWRCVYQRHRGLAIPLLAHSAAGLGTMLAAYILSRG